MLKPISSLCFRYPKDLLTEISKRGYECSCRTYGNRTIAECDTSGGKASYRPQSASSFFSAFNFQCIKSTSPPRAFLKTLSAIKLSQVCVYADRGSMRRNRNHPAV